MVDRFFFCTYSVMLGRCANICSTCSALWFSLVVFSSFHAFHLLHSRSIPLFLPFFSFPLYWLPCPSITIFYHIKDSEIRLHMVDDYVILFTLSSSMSSTHRKHAPVSLWWWQFVFEIGYVIIIIIIYTT